MSAQQLVRLTTNYSIGYDWGLSCSWLVMASLVQDLRQAVRILLKSPAFAAIALLTLAIGIGANTAVFSVVNTVLLRPLPYENAKDIVALWEKRPRESQAQGPISGPDFVDWRRMAKSFSSLAIYDSARFSITGNGDPERVPGARVSAGFLEALGVQPRLGRTFQINEEQRGQHRVAIITNGLWQRGFASDPGVLGKTIGVNGESFEIVGVLPRNFRYPFAAECDLLVPNVFSESQLRFRGIHSFGGIARLKPGVSVEQAQAQMDAVSKELEQKFSESNTGHMASLVPLHEQISGKIRPALVVLLGAVFLVVLIACANIANLLLARAAVRRKEMAVRAALGCSRWRLIQQSFAESAVLALAGAGLGILLAMWGLDLLRSQFFHKIEFFSLAGLDTAGLDWRVLLFTLACAVTSTLLFGMSPALAAAGVDLNEAIRSGGRGATAGDRHKFRSALVVAEVALSLVLLTGAGLLAKSFISLMNVNPGFQPEHLLTAGITMPRSQFASTEKAAAFYDRLLERAEVLPGVRSVALTDTLPLAGDDNRMGSEIEGRQPKAGERTRLHPRLVSTGYLETMGIPLLQGRHFGPTDASGKLPVAIMSETAARRYWPDGRAIGHRFRFSNENAPWFEVVGIVGAVHNRALEEESTPDVYLPFRTNPFLFAPTDVTLVLRTTQDEKTLASSVRATVASLDRSLPVSSIQPMETFVDDSVSPKKFNLILIGIFAIIAVTLAVAGLYGVMAYLVSQRTGEIGIRMALGARQSDVLRLVIGKGLRLAGIGVAIGVVASFVSVRVMSSLLFGVQPRDPEVFAIVPIILVAMAVVASYVPARRAANVDPMVALRSE